MSLSQFSMNRKPVAPNSMPTKKTKGGFFGDEEDTEPAMYFSSQSVFPRSDKELMTSPSPSQLSAAFNSGMYGQASDLLAAGLSLPQRGMANTSFPRSSAGPVTPTSMAPNFPASLQQQQQQQQQVSPNSLLSRNLFPMNQRGILNQIPSSQAGLGSQMKQRTNPITSALMSSGANPIAGLAGFGRFSSAGDRNQQPLDLSDFPSLGTRSTPPTPVAPNRSYVGMVNKPVQEQAPEFQIQPEDFPALSGSQNPPPVSGVVTDPSRKTPTMTSGQMFDSVQNKVPGGRFPGDEPRGIQTHQDGTVSNIPSGMVTDQFGMVGLLTFIRAAETDSNLVALAPGIDLTTLGLNLNSPEHLYNTFQSPWADAPCRPQDIDFHVPQEYLTNIFIQDKLAPIKLSRYGEDLLFFLFYMNGGDVLQLAAAAELYNRDWRYHKDERIWITRVPGVDPQLKTNGFERGTYYFFDAQNWRKVVKEFHLEYDKLEDRPHLQSSMTHNANRASNTVMTH